MITIVADENIPFLKGVLEPFCRMEYLPGDGIQNEDLAKADGLIIRTRTRCDPKLLEGTPVRFIATATIGYDHIDTTYCASKGITWSHSPGCNARGVFQYMAAALLHLAQADDFSLTGKMLGVVGVGHVGSRVVKLGEALQMNVLQNDPPRERIEGKGRFVSLKEIADESDIITLHTPLNLDGPDKTYHLIGQDFLTSLTKKPYIINTSRGQVIDNSLLKEKINRGGLRGCVLDVWESEPRIDRELMALTTLATPHIAGYSIEGKANGTASCVRNASRFFDFGIDDWYPQNLPGPANNVIRINTKGISSETIVNSAIKASYQITSDDIKLRREPELFEKIRNEYPVRREFPFYAISLLPHHQEAEETLQELGFGNSV
jgi:erythronate-4-phosphate dehydrogenase